MVKTAVKLFFFYDFQLHFLYGLCFSLTFVGHVKSPHHSGQLSENTRASSTALQKSLKTKKSL